MNTNNLNLADTIKDAELINDYEFANRLHKAGLDNSMNNYNGRITPAYFDCYELAL